MGIGNEACNGAQDRERLDLQMGRGGDDICFVERDVRVVLLIDIEVLDQPLLKKVVKREFSGFQVLYAVVSTKIDTRGVRTDQDMLRGHTRQAFVHDDHRATNTAAIARDKDRTVMIVDVHAHKFTNTACTSKLAEVVNESSRVPRETDDRAVHVDDVGVRAIDFSSRSGADVCTQDQLDTPKQIGPTDLRHRACMPNG